MKEDRSSKVVIVAVLLFVTALIGMVISTYLSIKWEETLLYQATIVFDTPEEYSGATHVSFYINGKYLLSFAPLNGTSFSVKIYLHTQTWETGVTSIYYKQTGEGVYISLGQKYSKIYIKTSTPINRTIDG